MQAGGWIASQRPRQAINTAFDPYTANLGRVYGQDPNRSLATTEPLPLEAQSVLPALLARHTDRPGRPQRDTDTAERYSNPNRELALQWAP